VLVVAAHCPSGSSAIVSYDWHVLYRVGALPGLQTLEANAQRSASEAALDGRWVVVAMVHRVTVRLLVVSVKVRPDQRIVMGGLHLGCRTAVRVRL
jgi:hypothetical protein